MYLLIGSGEPLPRLAGWCLASRPTRVVLLASELSNAAGLEGCDVMALPAPCAVDDLPSMGRVPSLIVVLHTHPLSDTDLASALAARWPGVPIIGPMEPSKGAMVDVLRPADLLLSAVKDRIRAHERHTGAAVLDAHFRDLEPGSNIAIFCHDNPDPDALAAALAMQRLAEHRGHRGRIYHGGLVEHHQNRAMVQLLGIELTRVMLGWEVNDIVSEADAIVAVDFHQPGANNMLPADVVPNIILDHHSVEDLPAADVAIVHPEFSSTSSLVTSLLTALDLDMDARLATALAFGIRTDTLGFTRGISTADIRALSWLNAWVDHDLMRRIESPPRSKESLAAFAEALASMTTEDGVLLAPVLHLVERDALAQIADFLLATEGISTVVVYGPRLNRVILSARTKDPTLHLGRCLAGAFPEGAAGGHKALAGGQVGFQYLVGNEHAEPDEAMGAMTVTLRSLLGGGDDE
jgi:nanoRNase/pAp phosphatase (c-di-AMP/oligoRNAs hydrolase)